MIPRDIEALAKLLEQLPTLMANAYANSRTQKPVPYVDNHFTHGGQKQYNFPPLNPEYAAEKAGQVKTLRKGMKAQGFTVSQAKGGNLPILVRTGKLRSMVSGMRHVVFQNGDTATVVFAGLPEYAKHLHEGTPKMPKRSPVQPGPDDLAALEAECRRLISAATMTGAAGKTNFGDLPGKVRVV